jgi:tetratricopeptide (TPR) repeat protein
MMPRTYDAYNGKGNALWKRGDLLAALSRHEEAEESYADAVEAFDEALRRAPDYIDAYFNKALTLLQWGESMRPFVQTEVTRSRWEEAQAHCRHVLALAPQLEAAEELFAFIREQLDNLEARSSSEG